MSHLKRNSAPKLWPVPRKGTKFVIKSGEKEMPVVVVLRDVLGIAKTRGEVKKSIFNKNIKVCGREVLDEKYQMKIFDTISIIPAKKTYRMTLSDKGKFTFEEVPEKEATKKIAKITGKKMLKGKKMQLSLIDGRTSLSETPCNVNDSVLLDLEKKKVEKILPFKIGSNMLVIEGKHIGEKGKIKEIDEKLKMVESEIEGKKVNVLIKQIMILE
jgi:small subunit ribosomal protein S4e